MGLKDNAILESGTEVLHNIRCTPAHAKVEIPVVVQVSAIRSYTYYKELVELLRERKHGRIVLYDFNQLNMGEVSDRMIRQMLSIFKSARIKKVTFDLREMPEDDILLFYTALKPHVSRHASFPRFHCHTGLEFPNNNWHRLFEELTRHVAASFGGRYATPIFPRGRLERLNRQLYSMTSDLPSLGN